MPNINSAVQSVLFTDARVRARVPNQHRVGLAELKNDREVDELTRGGGVRDIDGEHVAELAVPNGVSLQGFMRAGGARERTVGPAGQFVAPPEVRQTAAVLADGYRDQTELALNAVTADGYADFVDTFGGTGRLRPDDIESAFLRLNAGIWSVGRDLEDGTIGPEDFGKATWGQVDGRAIYDLALTRLHEDALDYEATIPAMLASDTWQARPIVVKDPKQGPVELTPDNISVLHRSIYSLAAPNEAAETIEAMPFAQQMRDSAVSVAGAGFAERQQVEATAQVATAHQLFVGGNMPANTSQALMALMNATGVALATPVASDFGVTEEDLQKKVRNGDITAFVPAGPGFIELHDRPIPEIAAEVRAKIENKELDHLGPEALQQLLEMTGPADSPGKLIEERLESEGRSRFWREISSEAINVAAIGLVSGSVGAFVEGFGAGLAGLHTVAQVENATRATIASIRAARFVANAATFTTVSGISQGDIDPLRYPVDMGVFYVLGQAGKLSQVAAKVIKGSGAVAHATRTAAGHGTAVVTSSGLLTIASAVEMAARGQSPTKKEMLEQLAHSLIMASVLHGINSNLAKLTPHIAPDAKLRGVLTDLQGKANAEGVKYATTLAKHNQVRAQLDKLPKGSPQAKKLEARATELLRQANARRGAVNELSEAVSHLETVMTAKAKHIQTQAMLTERANTAKAPTQNFVKDKPIVGYQIKSSKFEDIPAAIRKHIGSVDQTKYTPEYLKKNIGSVFALQMSDGKPDFYVIGKDTFVSKYKSVGLSQVQAKNGKLLDGLKGVEGVGGLIQSGDARLVGALKTVPVEMVSMSALGYAKGKAAKIQSPWGEQTKPAGQEAYLVWDAGKSQYYMVNVGKDGLPIGYVPGAANAKVAQHQP